VAQVGFEDRLSWGQCAKPKCLAEQEIAWLIWRNGDPVRFRKLLFDFWNFDWRKSSLFSTIMTYWLLPDSNVFPCACYANSRHTWRIFNTWKWMECIFCFPVRLQELKEKVDQAIRSPDSRPAIRCQGEEERERICHIMSLNKGWPMYCSYTCTLRFRWNWNIIG